MKPILVAICAFAAIWGMAQTKTQVLIPEISSEIIEASSEVKYIGHDLASISKKGIRLVEDIVNRNTTLSLAELDELQNQLSADGHDHDFCAELIFALVLWQALADANHPALEFVNCLPTETKKESSVQNLKGERLEKWWMKKSGKWKLGARKFVFFAGGAVRMSIQGYWFRFKSLAKLN